MPSKIFWKRAIRGKGNGSGSVPPFICFSRRLIGSHLNYQRRWKRLGNKVQQLRLSISKNLFFPCMSFSLLLRRSKGANARFAPTVFYDWFLLTWPEPSAWLASRLAYSRTLAVMSMIGYVLGWVCRCRQASEIRKEDTNDRLGDRHGENILFDSLTGDTVHVDLNCLFDKVSLLSISSSSSFLVMEWNEG
jgi:phosphatidylinositol kinase/protein kinase (PI-3  family)